MLAVGWEGVPGNAHYWYQDAGYALAVGDFDGSGRPDLAIAVPGYGGNESPNFDKNIGAEVVLYSDIHMFSDDFETGSSARWSATVP